MTQILCLIIGQRKFLGLFKAKLVGDYYYYYYFVYLFPKKIYGFLRFEHLFGWKKICQESVEEKSK